MEQELTPEQARLSQNIGGAIFIFVAVYYFFSGNADTLTSGVLLIIGFGVSKDIRMLAWFLIKWVLAKTASKKAPTYDFSKANIVQHSGRDSVVNYGAINYN